MRKDLSNGSIRLLIYSGHHTPFQGAAKEKHAKLGKKGPAMWLSGCGDSSASRGTRQAQSRYWCRSTPFRTSSFGVLVDQFRITSAVHNSCSPGGSKNCSIAANISGVTSREKVFPLSIFFCTPSHNAPGYLQPRNSVEIRMPAFRPSPLNHRVALLPKHPHQVSPIHPG